MSLFLGSILAALFAALALLHAYWALGGAWGQEGAVPVVNGARAFQPGRAATWTVAGLLTIAGALLAALGGVLPTAIPLWALATATGGLSLVFLARAVGDFRLVGFFKRPAASRFARLDTLVYSPLCLAVAIGAACLAGLRLAAL